MRMAKRYRIFVPETELDKFKGQEDRIFSETLVDEETQETFQAKIMISQSPREGYDELVLQARGSFIPGQWYLKIVEREEEEESEPVTVFEAKRLGERKGYMLRSMMAEEKEKLKKETMTSELEKRLRRKQEIVKELLKDKQ